MSEIDKRLIRVTSFLEGLYLLEGNGETRKAVEQVVSQIDDILNEGCFGECAEIMNMANVENLSPSVIISFLGITLAAKEKIGVNREIFVGKVRESLLAKLDNGRVDTLLQRYS